MSITLTLTTSLRLGRVIKYDFYEAEKYKASNYYEYDAEGRIIHKYYQRGEQISQESTFEYEAL